MLQPIINASPTSSLQTTSRDGQQIEGTSFAERMYFLAFEPIRVETGMHYACTQSYLDALNWGHFAEPNTSVVVSPFKAVTEVVRQNKTSKEVSLTEAAAINRLFDAISHAIHYSFTPDLAIKCFADMDIIFFGARLCGNVCVHWRNDKRFAPGIRGHTIGPRPEEPRQCRIELNAGKIFWEDHSPDRSLMLMMSTLLHEMCHAYEFVCCVLDYDQTHDDHDKYFRTKIHAVHRRAQQLFGLNAIEDGEPYKQDHPLSREWTD